MNDAREYLRTHMLVFMKQSFMGRIDQQFTPEDKIKMNTSLTEAGRWGGAVRAVSRAVNDKGRIDGL